MSANKVIISADIHLDTPLRGLSRYPGVPVDEVRAASRSALGNLVDLAISESAALLLVGGDVYDGAWSDAATGLQYAREMARLDKAGVRVGMVHGNHDCESVLTRKVPLPANVHIFPSDAPTSWALDDLGIVVHGVSYKERSVTENLAVNYPAAVPGCCNIGLLHTSLTGRAGHENYAPCSVEDLVARGYQAWALGHVHEREVVLEDPLVIWPGCLQGRHVNEAGPKGATVALIRDDVIVSAEHVILDAVRWASCDVLIDDFATPNDVHAALRAGLEDTIRREGTDRPVLVRLTLRARRPVAALADSIQLRDDARAVAAAVSQAVWIEKIRIEIDDPGGSARAGPLTAELAELIAAGIEGGELPELLEAEFAGFLARLPSGIAADGAADELRRGEVERLIREACAALDARLGEAA